MKNYRFTAQEINQMKEFILTSINNETEKRTAWRARLCYEMEAQCSSTKKSRDRGTRMLALYEQLTTNDLPNWLPTNHTPDQPKAATTDHTIKFFYAYPDGVIGDTDRPIRCVSMTDKSIENLIFHMEEMYQSELLPIDDLEFWLDDELLEYNCFIMHSYYNGKISMDEAINKMRMGSAA